MKLFNKNRDINFLNTNCCLLLILILLFVGDRLTGDMYVVTDCSYDMKLVYNERSLGIFPKPNFTNCTEKSWFCLQY